MIPPGQIKECQTNRMGYREWHEQAEQWQKKGTQQRWCGECQRYKFPKERCRYFREADPTARGTTEREP